MVDVSNEVRLRPGRRISVAVRAASETKGGVSDERMKSVCVKVARCACVRGRIGAHTHRDIYLCLHTRPQFV